MFRGRWATTTGRNGSSTGLRDPVETFREARTRIRQLETCFEVIAGAPVCEVYTCHTSHQHIRIRTQNHTRAHSHSRVQAARGPVHTQQKARLTRRKQKKTHGFGGDAGPRVGPKVPARGAATRVHGGRRAKMRVASRRKIVNITSAYAVLPPRVFLLGIFALACSFTSRAVPRPGAIRRTSPRGKQRTRSTRDDDTPTENNKLFSYTTVPCTRYTIR